jgi:hypothetical protein
MDIFVRVVFIVDPCKQKVDRNNKEHGSGKGCKGAYHVAKYTAMKFNNIMKVS